MKDKLLKYRNGFLIQIDELTKQQLMTEGALQFCDQLLSELDEEAPASSEEPEEQEQS